jgi:hypothetical protein
MAALHHTRQWPTVLSFVFTVQELRRFESIVRRGELAALQADVGTLRTELLRVQDELEASQVGRGLGVCLGSAV